MECYECVFWKFVDVYEIYLRFEVNEGMINVVNESYEKEKENKFFFDVELSMWKLKMKSVMKVMLKLDYKLCWLSKIGRSFIMSSVREKCRIFEEVWLRVEVLE